MLPEIPGPTDDTLSTLKPGVLVGDPIYGAYKVVSAWDPAGNLISIVSTGMNTVNLVKHDAQLKILWTVPVPAAKDVGATTPGTVNYASLATDTVGNIVLAGALNTVGSVNPLLVKMSPTGTLVWAKTYGVANTGSAYGVAVGADDSITVAGFSNGQLPGQPPTSKFGDFQLRYGSDGSIITTTQFGFLHGGSGLQLDSRNNAYLMFVAVTYDSATASTISIAKFDPSCQMLWGLKNATALMYAGPANGSTIYLGQNSPGPIPPPGKAAKAAKGVQYITQLDSSTGAFISSRSLGERTVTLDPIEQYMWKGTFSTVTDMVMTSDAVYFTGIYSNTYLNGSNPKKPSAPGFIVKLSLTGEQVWFKAYDAVQPTRLSVGKQNQLLLFSTKNNVSSGNQMMYLINSLDGNSL